MGTVLDLLEAKRDHLSAALGRKRDFESWFASAKTWAAQTEGSHKGALAYDRCRRMDVLAAFTSAAQLGLLIDGEECMVMVRGKKEPKVKVEVGARGVVRKAGQAGWTVNARTVREGDEIDIDEGAGTVTHRPAWMRGERPGKALGYYAVARKRDGTQIVRSMSAEEVERHSTGTGAWREWGDAMGEKTAILSLKKVLYLGDELEDLISASAVEVGPGWGEGVERKDAEGEPAPVPETTKDRVLAAAGRARSRQDQEAVDEAFVAGDEPGPARMPEEDDLPI